MIRIARIRVHDHRNVDANGKGASHRVPESEVTTAGDLCCPAVTALGMVADMELKVILDRHRVRIEAAKGSGSNIGRKKQVDDRSRQLAAAKVPQAQSARDLGTSRMSVCHAMKCGDGQAAKTGPALARGFAWSTPGAAPA